MLGDLPRKDQRATGELYARGLLTDGQRKSMQPMAARLGEHSDQSDHPVRGFRSPGVGGRVAADAGRFVPRVLTSLVFWWVVCHGPGGDAGFSGGGQG
jgi:hypothetical protein